MLSTGPQDNAPTNQSERKGKKRKLEEEKEAAQLELLLLDTGSSDRKFNLKDVMEDFKSKQKGSQRKRRKVSCVRSVRVSSLPYSTY